MTRTNPGYTARQCPHWRCQCSWCLEHYCQSPTAGGRPEGKKPGGSAYSYGCRRPAKYSTLGIGYCEHCRTQLELWNIPMKAVEFDEERVG